MTYSHMANATLPLARSGFTTEFGKGSGGSHSLWSPDKLVEFTFLRLLEFVVFAQLEFCLKYLIIKLNQGLFGINCFGVI